MSETPEFIKAGTALVGDEEVEAVTRVLRSGMLAQGTEVAAFEAEFAQTFELGRPCVAVNSGTSGLHLGLLAAGVGPGDEVIVPSFTFAATANAVALTGATPVFADIDAASYCLDPASAAAAITPRTVGIMPVHLYGHPAAMGALGALADEHGLTLFEDAAQAHGARLDGRPVGTWGRFAMFSLYPTKNMTSGEGGMVACSDAEVVRSMQLLRNQGMLKQYHNERVGLNNRMTDLHAAVGRVQLTKVLGWNERRRATAAFYSEHLEGVGTPVVAPGVHHVYHQYTISVPDDRDGFAAALRDDHQVGSGAYYPVPVHRLAPFAEGRAHLPVTDAAASHCLSLPVHPGVGERERERVVRAVNQLVRAGA